MEIYPCDLTDEEWTILEPLIPPGKPGGRPREVDLRAVQSAHLLPLASWVCLAHAAAGVPSSLYGLWLFCAVSR